MRGDRFTNKCIFKQSIKKQKTGTPAKCRTRFMQWPVVKHLRGTFFIDPEGILKAYELHDNSIGRSVVEMLRKIKAAKFVNENPGQVCPVNWEKGKKTLKPGLELVGKI